MLRFHQPFYYVFQPLFQLHFVLLGKKAFGWCSPIFLWVSFKVRQSLPEFSSGFGVAFNGEKGVSGCSGTTWSFPKSGTSSNSASSLVTFSTSNGERMVLTNYQSMQHYKWINFKHLHYVKYILTLSLPHASSIDYSFSHNRNSYNQIKNLQSK